MQRGVPGSAEPTGGRLVVLLELSARGANAQRRRRVDLVRQPQDGYVRSTIRRRIGKLWTSETFRLVERTDSSFRVFPNGGKVRRLAMRTSQNIVTYYFFLLAAGRLLNHTKSRRFPRARGCLRGCVAPTVLGATTCLAEALAQGEALW